MSDPRVDPASMTPRGRSVIHDLGYRPYTGPRLGEASIARALIFTGFKNAFGLGRSAKSKALPFILLGMNLFPAVILVGALTLFGADRLPIGYAQYASTTQVLLSIFVASQAPVLFSRDLRHGSITLYLARPLKASTYALSRWTSLLLASLVFVWLPLVIMYVGALLGELDFGEQTKEASIAVFLGLVLALTLTGIGGLIASWSTRRGFAIVATIAVLLIGNGIVTALQGIAYRVRLRRDGRPGRRVVLAVLALPRSRLRLGRRQRAAQPPDEHGHGGGVPRWSSSAGRRLPGRAALALPQAGGAVRRR